MSEDTKASTRAGQTEHLQISQRRHIIEKDRREKMRSVMEDYDKNVFYPARKALVQDCFKLGHHPTHHHSNGLGWSWFYCGYCGGRTRITGPNGETSPDAGAPEPEQPKQGE